MLALHIFCNEFFAQSCKESGCQKTRFPLSGLSVSNEQRTVTHDATANNSQTKTSAAALYESRTHRTSIVVNSCLQGKRRSRLYLAPSLSSLRSPLVCRQPRPRPPGEASAGCPPLGKCPRPVRLFPRENQKPGPRRAKAPSVGLCARACFTLG